MKKQIVFLVLFVALIAVGAFYIVQQRGFEGFGQGGESSEDEFVTYTNKKGQTWKLQAKGGSHFTVASAETYPKFVDGVIDPIKVSLGDTQFMKVTVRSDVPMKKVWAEIENDKETDIVELSLAATTTVDEAALRNQPFIVDENNILIVNDERSEPIISRLAEKVRAQSVNLVDYVYEGKWVVHDTRTITYRTTFVAEDINNRQVKLVMAWSDPCTFSGNNISFICNLADVEGIDNATVSFTGPHTVTIYPTGVFVWTPGYSITIPDGAQFVIQDGGQMKQAYLYYTDADGDRYAPNSTKTWDLASSKSGFVRVSSSYGINDCYDANANARPGQTKWWTQTGVTNNDFNCDGTGYRRFTKQNSSYDSSGYPEGVDLSLSQVNLGTPPLCINYGGVYMYDPNDYPCGYLVDFSGSFYNSSAYVCDFNSFAVMGPIRNTCK